jgi:lathosterol oxidase
MSSLVFTAICAVCLYAYHHGWTKIYLEVEAYPLWYLLASGVAVILLYETHYYWLHRAMHIPAIFRIVHKVHHESIHPTVSRPSVFIRWRPCCSSFFFRGFCFSCRRIR